LRKIFIALSFAQGRLASSGNIPEFQTYVLTAEKRFKVPARFKPHMRASFENKEYLTILETLNLNSYHIGSFKVLTLIVFFKDEFKSVFPKRNYV